MDPAGARPAARRPALQFAFPNGEVAFVEDRTGPPNRAYLKLWEALVRLRRWPMPGERCLDLGASPGGWTYVVAKLGAEVIAIDKAPLDPRVAAMAGVAWRGESAFALDPTSVGPVDWLFSDIVCYPARLLRLVEKWRASGLAKNFVCTLKFQGADRPRFGESVRGDPGSAGPTFASQQARIDVHPSVVLTARSFLMLGFALGNLGY